MSFRRLTNDEIAALERSGSSCDDWRLVEVCEEFFTAQIQRSRLGGVVRIEAKAQILDSKVVNYHISQGAIVESVTALECRCESEFGNGVVVATMNECGGRAVKIYDALTAQIAYILALYRHRSESISTLEAMIDAYSASKRSTVGRVGRDSRVVGCRFVREVNIGDSVSVEGASVLECGTILSGASVGVDVKAHNFIIAEGAKIDNGVIIERCFIGESSIFDKAFTAVDSLFFANSHCENGEAASIFAGPYTVSHHKSTLLIAGLFSFFNAGSGSNQSNHLFKSGAVHQAVHLRGSKFASGAYIMAPAIEGPFTMVMGHHTHHHDTSKFPFSYLVEKDGRSMLMPAANLVSYGTARDIEKWQARDRRSVKRDTINFEQHNPYLTAKMVEALDTLHALQHEDLDAESYNYNKTTISSRSLQRAIGLYNKGIVASLGAMLGVGEANEEYQGAGRWVDLGGEYITIGYVDDMLDAIQRGDFVSLGDIDAHLQKFALHYDDYAHSWARSLYGSLLGSAPTEQQCEEAVVAGRNAMLSIEKMYDADKQKDCSMLMAVGYGIDSEDEEDIRADYYVVRGLR